MQFRGSWVDRDKIVQTTKWGTSTRYDTISSHSAATIQCEEMLLQSYALPTELSRVMVTIGQNYQDTYVDHRLLSPHIMSSHITCDIISWLVANTLLSTQTLSQHDFKTGEGIKCNRS